MSVTNHIITLDLLKPSCQSIVYLTTGNSNVHRLIFNLCSGSKPVDITPLVAVLYAQKPDGSQIYNDCVIENSRISFDIPEAMLDTAGKTECELQIATADSVIITPKFIVCNEKSIYPKMILLEDRPDDWTDYADNYYKKVEEVFLPVAFNDNYHNLLTINTGQLNQYKNEVDLTAFQGRKAYLWGGPDSSRSNVVLTFKKNSTVISVTTNTTSHDGGFYIDFIVPTISKREKNQGISRITLEVRATGDGLTTLFSLLVLELDEVTYRGCKTPYFMKDTYYAFDNITSKGQSEYNALMRALIQVQTLIPENNTRITSGMMGAVFTDLIGTTSIYGTRGQNNA